MDSPWQHGMVEWHGQVMSDTSQAFISETKVSGTAQMTVVLLMTSFASHLQPGRTGYSTRTLIYGVDERLRLRGLDHYFEQPHVAALSRDEPARTISLPYRALAMQSVTELDHAEMWE